MEIGENEKSSSVIDKKIEYVKEHILKEIMNTRYTNCSEKESLSVNAAFAVLMEKTRLIIRDECYVGISANPVQSLTAHGIDYHERNTFLWMYIPHEYAKECKQAIATIEGFDAVVNDSSDFIDDTYPNVFIYIYKTSDNTIEKIDTSGFVPIEKFPEIPIVIEKKYVNGKFQKCYSDDNNKKEYDTLADSIMSEVSEGIISEIKITHRKLNSLSAEFGKNCCIINYDNGTSQCGGYQSYRSGEKSRKKVSLFTGEYPEYMICRDMTVFDTILRYFLIKCTKPGKRQNIKWVNMKEE